MATAKDVMKTIKDNEVLFVDLRFTDTKGKEQHVSVPAKAFEDDKFELGHAFDGSSIAGWKGIEASDMLLMPDPDTARMDPFREENTLILTCDVIEPSTGKGYDRDPRSLAKRAEAYSEVDRGWRHRLLRSRARVFHLRCGHLERRHVGLDSCGSSPKKRRGRPASIMKRATWRIGPPVKGGYFPVPPTDSLQDIRSEICLLLEQQGVEVEVHHHEVAAPGQCEIGTKFSTLTKRADWLQILKYTVWNVAASYGKTATFMPKPVVGDNGSGMHVHQSVWKGGTNLFAGNGYGGSVRFRAATTSAASSSTPSALNAITNPGTNSYKRLVPGFEAPINLAYSARNRSASMSHSVCFQSKGTPYRSALSRSDRECLSWHLPR